MKEKPVLVIMAAGMGSRFGGLKQIAPVDEYGNIIIDFSIFDAKEAGFEKVVFIIKKAIEAEFKEHIGNRIAEKIQVEYVYQETDLLPEGYALPEGRVKPWGTGHAILCCKPVIHSPFMVINADDYYGKTAFKTMYDALTAIQDGEQGQPGEDGPCGGKYQYAMVGYRLSNTLTDFGSVARGVCTVDENGKLADIVERTMIERRGADAAYSEDGGNTWTDIAGDSTVSMNMWGFSESIMPELENRFSAFLDKALAENPLKGEYFLPFVVDELLKEDKAAVTVLTSADRWYGVTYKEDKKQVMDAIQGLKDQGLYPQKLWE